VTPEVDYSPAPARQLFHEGKWADWVPDSVRSRYAEPIPYVERPARRSRMDEIPLYEPALGSVTRGGRATRFRAKKPQPLTLDGRPKTGSKLAHVTAGRILELKAMGMSMPEIAKRLGCTRATCYARLSGRRGAKC